MGQQVTEDWPTTGIPSAQYSRDKVEAERVVREIAGRHGDLTLTVVRPTLVLQPDAGSEIGRYFLGPLLFGAARLLPGSVAKLLPLPLPALSVAFVHADDVADALVRILGRRAAGPFNLAAEPLMDAAAIARALGTRRGCRSRHSRCGRRCTPPSSRTWSPPSRAGSTSASCAPALDTDPGPPAARLDAGAPRRRGAGPVRGRAGSRRGRRGPAAPPGGSAGAS